MHFTLNIYLFWFHIFSIFFLPFCTYKHRNSFVLTFFLYFISFFTLFRNQSIAIRLNLCNCNMLFLASPLFTVVCVCGAGDLTYLCLQTQQNKSLWNFCTYEREKNHVKISIYILLYIHKICVCFVVVDLHEIFKCFNSLSVHIAQIFRVRVHFVSI